MNTRMVNAIFEDLARDDFDPETNTGEFIAAIPSYFSAGVNAFTLNLQGGMPGYEGALKLVGCNEDATSGEEAVAKMRATVRSAAGYGLMLQTLNQHYPFTFEGTQDDAVYYEALKEITGAD